MKPIRLIASIFMTILIISVTMTSHAQEGRGTFKVFDNDMAVVDLSKKMKESGSVFKDKDGDGLYDSIEMYGETLSCEMDEANAYGVTYQDGKKVVYYPSMSASIPLPGTYSLYGFLHYFDQEGKSLYFAIIVKALSEKEQEALRKATGNKKDKKIVMPYSADFIDSNGLRVGLPSLLILPYSKLIYNADFQKFNKAKSTVLIGTNPSAQNREIFILRKVPEFTDRLLLIHYKWY